MPPIVRSALVALFASLVVAWPAPAQAPAIPPYNRDDAPGEPPPVPGAEGDIQNRGPVHEGFAQPGGVIGPSDVVPKQPPAPIPETPPAQRPAGDGGVWTPGYWSWDADRRDFLWITGSWRVTPAGRNWVPGHWAKVDGGWRWVCGLWAVSRAPAQYLPAPPASLDRGPAFPPPAVGYSYVPGTWLYEGRWLWRPGYYAAPRAGLVYIPDRYVWTPRGYLFVPGFWDRPLDARGVLYAPVYFGSGFTPASGWAFRPRATVDLGSSLASLWVGPGAGYYAFGDYYAPRFARAGYRNWLAYGPGTRDPLYGYYQNANRNDPTWRKNLVATYNGRARWTTTVPLTTLAAPRLAGASPRTVAPLNRSTPSSPVYRHETVRSAPSAVLRPHATAVHPRPVAASPRHTPPVQHHAPTQTARHSTPPQHHAPAHTARHGQPAHSGSGHGHHR